MPMPVPSKGESQSDFVSRCISFLSDEKSDLTQEQRVAACYDAYRRAKGIKVSEGNVSNDKLVLFEKEGKFQKVDVKLSDVHLWKKQVLRYGKWIHPVEKDVTFEITPAVLSQVVANFNAGIPDIAPVTATHSDDPRMKMGTVKSWVVDSSGLHAIMSVDDVTLNDNLGKPDKEPGVSVWLDMNYTHKETGEKIGAVIKHVALVNHPYIEGMSGFEAVLSEAKEDIDYVPMIFMSEDKQILEKGNMSKDELLKKLKEEHQIDVIALLSDSDGLKVLQKRVEDGDLVEKLTLSDELKDKLRKALKLSESDELDVVKALESFVADSKSVDETELSELKTENTNLKKRLDEMDAEKHTGVLLSEGFIFPQEKENFEKLYISDRSLFDDMAKSRRSAGQVVKLGETGHAGEAPKEDAEKTKLEVERHSEAAKAEGLIG